MKNSSLKFACIFIILIFCIAPLSAIDLNCDDNNKCINQSYDKSSVNLTDVSDAVKTNSSGAADNVHLENKSIDNATDGVKISTDKDFKIKASDSLNDSKDNESESEKSLSPNLKINVIDMVPGNDVMFEVTGNESFYGVIHVVLDDNKASKNVLLINGYAKTSFKTDKDFALGEHTLYAYTDGDDRFGSDEASASFMAKEKITRKVDPHLSVYANSVYKYQNATVNVFANTSIDGDVSLKLSNCDTPYTVHLSKGRGSITIPDLPAGEYTATVSFEGDDTFLASEDSTSFSVSLYKANLNLKVKNSPQGDYTLVFLSADEGFKGNVTLKISGCKETYGCSFNGNANSFIQKIKLDPGNYTVTAIFKGNDDFRPEETNASFTVNPTVKIDPKLRVDVPDIMEGKAANVRVFADDRFGGIINIKLNNSDKVYRVQYAKGCNWTLQKIHDLPAGNYTATVSFEGNDKYLPSESSASFEVISNKINPKFRVEVKDIEEGMAASVRVYADKDYEGPIYIKLNNSDKVYTLKHNKGSAWSLLNIRDLPVGNYTATASFEGNDKYFPCESSASFQVLYKKIDPNFKVEVKDTIKGVPAYVRVYADERYEGPIYIKLNSSDKVYTVKHNKGSAWSLQNIVDLAPGNYTVTASFEGNEKYFSSKSSANFTVNERPF